VPDGFALVARLEQIAPDGTPAPGGVRFLDPDSNAPFTLGNYVKRLFFAPDGYYRLIAFVVTDRAFVASGHAPTAAAAETWLRMGADELPGAYYSIPFTANHQVTALIYEFRKQGNRNVSTLVPGRLDARTHLIKAGLYGALVGKP
ncbi:MAG TPA: hypothetical protein VLW75_07950, partial [Rhizomicrobium sp.]|nr:hypothetical protein [Rhizomicrobium sp.]